jgi:release factor glutamine methyltransferase
MTIAEAIREVSGRLSAAGIPAAEARREARLLVADTAGISHANTFAHPDTVLSPPTTALLQAVSERRARREPLAYVLGWRDFHGLRLKVTPSVLIPRPETELLVDAALEKIRQTGGVARVVDVGTGSGAVAIAIANSSPRALVYATDISADALAVARENAVACGVTDRVTLFEGDLIAPAAPLAPFDVIVSNPPYIAPRDIALLEPEVRDHEPRVALGTHEDALYFYRRLSFEAPPLLAPGGVLAVEVGIGQAERVAALWRVAGMESVTAADDLAGIPRVVSGKAPVVH